MGTRGPTPENHKLRIAPEAKRLKPPFGISKRARKTWNLIVDSLPPGYFRKGSIPLLRAYCEAEATHYNACKMIAKLDTPENPGGLFIKTNTTVKANPAIAIQTAKSGEMAQLATKLRLSVNAYRDKDNAGVTGREKPKSKREGLMFGGSK